MLLNSVFTSLMAAKAHLITTLDSDCRETNVTAKVTMTICHLVVNETPPRSSAPEESELLQQNWVPRLGKSSMAHWPCHFLILNK